VREGVDDSSGTANLGPGFECLEVALDMNNRFELCVVKGGVDRHVKSLYLRYGI
jgi:hypothetical protein